ncbi:MAG: hypothetical protein ACOYD4_11655 [Solirubrobacterales bacterium]
MPTNDLTPQQRAVKVVELLRERPYKTAEIALAVGVTKRRIYQLLEGLSGRDGVAITNYNGSWYLLSDGDLTGVRKLYHRLYDDLEATPRGQLILNGGALRRKEAVLLVRVLRRVIVPPEK